MRELRRLHAAAVTVVTTVVEHGFLGITVSAFCIVSLAPAIVLICLDQHGEALGSIKASGKFAVSILADSQEFLAEQFAGRAPLVSPSFSGVKYRLTRAGNPVLEDSLAWFDCAVVNASDAGDHAVILGGVREAGYGSGINPLLYFDGAYRELQID